MLALDLAFDYPFLPKIDLCGVKDWTISPIYGQPAISRTCLLAERDQLAWYSLSMRSFANGAIEACLRDAGALEDIEQLTSDTATSSVKGTFSDSSPGSYTEDTSDKPPSGDLPALARVLEVALPPLMF